MVIYYSWSGNTKAYAEALANRKGLPIFELKEKTARKSSGKWSFIKACVQGITKKKIEVTAMPDLSNYDEIFLCTPIWASGSAPAVRYFLDKAQLKDKKVNFLFTYGGMTEPDVIKNSALELIQDKGCVVGDIYAFAAKFRQPLDNKTVEDNINSIK